MTKDAHSEQFYHNENMAAATRGQDALVENPKKTQDRLRQRQAGRDHEDEESRIEMETERLFQLATQEGLIEEDGSGDRYNDVGELIKTGEIPNDTVFQEKLVGIQKRDASGEWEKSAPLGQVIPKTRTTIKQK